MFYLVCVYFSQHISNEPERIKTVTYERFPVESECIYMKTVGVSGVTTVVCKLVVKMRSEQVNGWLPRQYFQNVVQRG